MRDASERFEVTYRVRCAAGESVAGKARSIALEQTVELPAECLDEGVEATVVGRVESADETRGEVRISYPAAAAGSELPQFLNLLFGNISMQTGVRVEDVRWPSFWVSRPAGPQAGISGLRAVCGAGRDRPLLCVANKPLGASSQELAERCRELARAGVDVVKDDHSLADQHWAPFDERVGRCQQAVEDESARHGSRTLYFPNLTGGLRQLESRLERVRSLGCRGVLVSPWILGVDVLRTLALETDLLLLAHPGLMGAHFGAGHGIAPPVLLGDLLRIAGADAVIYPNVDGRFVLSAADSAETHRRLRRPLGELRPSMPTLAGGVEVSRVEEWMTAYGRDSMFLIGTSLYRTGNVADAAASLMDVLRAADSRAAVS